MLSKRTFMRAAMGLLVGAGIFTSFSASATTLAEYKEKGVRVGVGIMGLKPYIWQKPDGSYTGLEHEILEYVLKDIGISKYEYVVTEWQTLIPGLKADRWDIIMSGLGFNQERLAVGGIAFARPHLLYVDYVIVRKDSPIQTLADLKGKTVASVVGSMDSPTPIRSRMPARSATSKTSTAGASRSLHCATSRSTRWLSTR